jgi:hypothetical protein
MISDATNVNSSELAKRYTKGISTRYGKIKLGGGDKIDCVDVDFDDLYNKLYEMFKGKGEIDHEDFADELSSLVGSSNVYSSMKVLSDLGLIKVEE